MGRRSPDRARQAARSDPPTALLGAELDARRTQRVYTVEQFRQGRTPLQVIEVARNAAAVAEGAVQEAMRCVPPRAPSACREGCAWCCYKLVGTRSRLLPGAVAAPNHGPMWPSCSIPHRAWRGHRPGQPVRHAEQPEGPDTLASVARRRGQPGGAADGRGGRGLGSGPAAQPERIRPSKRRLGPSLKKRVPHRCLHVAQLHTIRLPHGATRAVAVREDRSRS